jgi:hypothetical protein
LGARLPDRLLAGAEELQPYGVLTKRQIGFVAQNRVEMNAVTGVDHVGLGKEARAQRDVGVGHGTPGRQGDQEANSARHPQGDGRCRCRWR